MEIKWHDIDPPTGKRRYLAAERFGGVWKFRWKLQKRGDWTRGLQPTRAMWEHILDALERRYWRREGVELEDIDEVKKIMEVGMATVLRDVPVIANPCLMRRWMKEADAVFDSSGRLVPWEPKKETA